MRIYAYCMCSAHSKHHQYARIHHIYSHSRPWTEPVHKNMLSSRPKPNCVHRTLYTHRPRGIYAKYDMVERISVTINCGASPSNIARECCLAIVVSFRMPKWCAALTLDKYAQCTLHTLVCRLLTISTTTCIISSGARKKKSRFFPHFHLSSSSSTSPLAYIPFLRLTLVHPAILCTLRVVRRAMWKMYI